MWALGTPISPQNFSDCVNGTRWVWSAFNECAADGRDFASIFLGLFSILCFVAASFPQYVQSCRTGNMDQALSIWFLLGWLAGDSCNFVGAFLSHQLPLQTYTAVYYVLADLFMLSLYIYYKVRNRGPSASLRINAFCGLALFGSAALLPLMGSSGPAAADDSTIGSARRLLSTGSSGEEPFSTQEIIGCVIGSVSSMFYLCSRIPQIVTNFRRRSTAGLALSLFCMVIVGNLTYGLSILLKNPDHGQTEANYIVHHVSWLIGSLGVMCMDIIIITQFFVFGEKNSSGSTAREREPLLPSDNRSPSA
ncbi:lysosomal amino acid transporter 1 homolog isoform 1-T2 [Anomaloglossus baeobatrachus]|uniref:lysosomal amino acid transporter 1 homolog n=1 Tax=Anomaloglossus baeobatrachus TaxID=238106 RepID=UPI003F501A9D